MAAPALLLEFVTKTKKRPVSLVLDADAIVEKRRLRRRASFWRLLSLVAIVVAVFAIALSSQDNGLAFSARDHIARISIEGIITDDREKIKLLNGAAKSDKVKAVVIWINSPGGTTTGSETLFEAIREISAVKPVVTVLGTVAASGGYIAAVAGDHIVARGNTITGSIGVIFQWAEVAVLLEKIGVKMEEIKSSPLKGAPSPFVPISDEARRVTREMVTDSYEWFVDLVASRRPFDITRARQLADGRVYTGRQALKTKLIDAIGGEKEALVWLTTVKQIDKSLKVVDWVKPIYSDFGLANSMVRHFVRAIGLSQWPGVAFLNEKSLAPERLRLDGLVALWHPSFANGN